MKLHARRPSRGEEYIGAGDSAVAGFVYGLSRGKSLTSVALSGRRRHRGRHVPGQYGLPVE